MEYKEINPDELRAGDIITAVFTPPYGSGTTQLHSNVRVSLVEDDLVRSEGMNFYLDLNTFYLIERPKPKLPTKIGSVVKAGSNTYVRVRENTIYSYEWVYDIDGQNREISTELLSGLDYTVVPSV